MRDGTGALASMRYAAACDVESAPPTPWLHRYAVLLAVATWMLIVAGAMVTSTGSGLAVPDWPTTYGYNMFTYPYSMWVGGIFYEHGHRLIASAVGLLTIGLCVWMCVVERRRWLRRLAFAALAAVIVQGLLGGLTVRYLLPTPISVSHACLAQLFFCMVVSIAVFTSPRRLRAGRTERAVAGRHGRIGFLLTAMIFIQLLLGAVMRHTESGLAVPDFPLAYGQVIPDFSPDAVERYNDHRRFELGVKAVTVDQIAWHMVHRAWAVVVLAAVCVGGWKIARGYRGVPRVTRPATLLILLVVAQVGLGAWTVLSEKRPAVASFHVAVGAATLATAWIMTLRCYAASAIPRIVEPRPTVSLREAVA